MDEERIEERAKGGMARRRKKPMVQAMVNIAAVVMRAVCAVVLGGEGPAVVCEGDGTTF